MSFFHQSPRVSDPSGHPSALEVFLWVEAACLAAIVGAAAIYGLR